MKFDVSSTSNHPSMNNPGFPMIKIAPEPQNGSCRLAEIHHR